MIERPILFSGAMVRALLDGSKTQTRRPCKSMNQWVNQECREVRVVDGKTLHFLKGATAPLETLRCPYGQPGDRLWVRETFALSVIDPDGGSPQDEPENWDVIYRADPDQPGGGWTDGEGNEIATPWKPSIHMPRWASRILLEITSVRVERLQDISEADAIAEGVEPHEIGQFAMFGLNAEERATLRREAAVGPYCGLWKTINGAGSWDANPWVWVIEFRRAEP